MQSPSSDEYHAVQQTVERLYLQYCLIQEKYPDEIESVGTFSEELYQYIRNYSKDKRVIQTAVKERVLLIVQKHKNNDKMMFDPPTRSTRRLSLYVAARMAFACRLPCSDTVKKLIGEIYRCEGTFKKLFACGFYSPMICYILGVDNLFGSQEVSTEAVGYFLYHATKGRMLFCEDEVLKNIVNVSFNGFDHPLAVAISSNNIRMFQLLLEYGADLYDRANECRISAMEILETGAGVRCPKAGACFIELALRAEPIISGKNFPSLLLLAKLASRKFLIQHFIPIQDLDLPETLIKYLQLKYN